MIKRFLYFIGAFAVVMYAAVPAYASGGESAGVEDPAVGWDHLWYELMIDIWVIGLIFSVTALYFMIRYKAKNPDDTGCGPKLSRAQALGWALIPVFVFMADDFYLAAKGWVLWNKYRRVPANAVEIKVIGSQWAWEYDYGDGVTSDVMYVPAGKPVVLRMTSDDVLHSFYIPQHRVKEDMMPGRVTYLWFLARLGKTLVTCTEFCGIGHSDMYGDVVGIPEGEFDAWLSKEKTSSAAASAVEKSVELNNG
ncbi:MAG: hypothetical protein IEMM0002_1552 [bacterium]|nr:MAG: hypothetical protein IEMM0002_1552 [bacterium]